MDRSDRFARDQAWDEVMSDYGSDTTMTFIDGEEFFADYDTDETDPGSDPIERDVQRAVDVCSEMIRTPGNISLERVVEDIREKCVEIETMDSNVRRLQDRFDRMISEYKSSTNLTGNYPNTFLITRGRELAHMFDYYENAQNPTAYPINQHMVVFENEPGVDGGGLRTEFFTEVCAQMMELFAYINPESNDPRMYISMETDEEVLNKINGYGGKFKDDGSGSLEPFTSEDLPKLYEMAGGMCQHATISKYSTGIPLSRALLTSMTSGDTGVTELQLGTIYLIEAYTGERDEVQRISQTAEYIDESFLETLVDRSKSVYLLDNPGKSRYISDFINGFHISRLLSTHNITPNELFDIIGGEPFSKDVYEAWWRSESNVSFTNRDMRARFLDLHLNHDQELISHMRETKPEMRTMTDNQILERYHQNTLRSIASVPTPSRQLRVFVTAANVNGMFAHSCCNTLDVNTRWLMNTTFSGGDIPWIIQADTTFMTRGYTRA